MTATSDIWNPVTIDDPYSWFHNIVSDRAYLPFLITTSTNDDRVHPTHARKMAAALQEAGHRVLFYENTDGGHSGVSNNAQAAFETALAYEFLDRTLDPMTRPFVTVPNRGGRVGAPSAGRADIPMIPPPRSSTP